MSTHVFNEVIQNYEALVQEGGKEPLVAAVICVAAALAEVAAVLNQAREGVSSPAVPTEGGSDVSQVQVNQSASGKVQE